MLRSASESDIAFSNYLAYLQRHVPRLQAYVSILTKEKTSTLHMPGVTLWKLFPSTVFLDECSRPVYVFEAAHNEFPLNKHICIKTSVFGHVTLQPCR